jgi:uncharacterized FAD-dependent dehydrogenase
MIRINELQLPLGHTSEALRGAILARLKLAEPDLSNFTVFKRSYDARKKKVKSLSFTSLMRKFAAKHRCSLDLLTIATCDSHQTPGTTR